METIIELTPELQKEIIYKTELITERLGINATFKISKENGRFKIKSSSFKITPMMFKNVHLCGDIYLDKQKNGYEIQINIGYCYEHWDGGINGCALGYIIFKLSGDITDISDLHERIRTTDTNILNY